MGSHGPMNLKKEYRSTWGLFQLPCGRNTNGSAKGGAMWKVPQPPGQENYLFKRLETNSLSSFLASYSLDS